MKKSFILGLTAGIVLTGASMVLAGSQIQAMLNNQIKIMLNGQIQEFRDKTTNELQYPITYNNRTYLPLRNIATLVGLEVDYDERTDTALLNQKEKTFDVILKEICEYNNRTNEYRSIRKLTLENQNIYACYFGEKVTQLEIYNENGVLIYSGNGDLGESDIYTDEKDKLYYYEYNLINGKVPEEKEYEKYYLEYKDGLLTSYQEKTVEKNETIHEIITRYVKEYNKQNPEYMISEVYWSYSDYIRFMKDGIFIDIYYTNEKIKAVVTENTYIDSKDGIRKDLSKRFETDYKNFIYNLAKVGNEDLPKNVVDNIYKDLEENKYGSKLISNDITIDGVRFNYYNQQNFFHTEIEFEFN